MASTTADIRAALAAAIVTGLGGGWQVSAYMLSLPTLPAVDIRPAGVTYDTAMLRGADDFEYAIRAMVAFNEPKGAQTLLDTLLDSTAPTGMKTIVEVDTTLGGLVSDLRVVSASEYKGIDVTGQPPILSVEFAVLVFS